MTNHNKKTRRWLIALSAILLGLWMIIGALIQSDRRHNAAGKDVVESINTLRIQRPGFADTHLRLLDDQWVIEQPCELNVNIQRLEPLMGALLPTEHSYAAADVDLEAAGLTEPLATVYLNNIRIDIGKTDLGGDRRYIKRGDRVEFAPEWILSLVNGGLSAIATLEVFDTQISAIQVLNDYDAGFAEPTESIPDWQALSAQQIVSWPLQPEELALMIQRLNIEHGDSSSLLTIYTYSQFSALHFENEQCAFILSNESLPDITWP